MPTPWIEELKNGAGSIRCISQQSLSRDPKSAIDSPGGQPIVETSQALRLSLLIRIPCLKIELLKSELSLRTPSAHSELPLLASTGRQKSFNPLKSEL